VNLSIIIPSKTASNLVASVMGIRHNDLRRPSLPVIVVDDGLDMNDTLPNVRYVQGVKPFIFARNVNIGIAAAGDDDVILMNDDAVLRSRDGLSDMVLMSRLNPTIGICSAAIDGEVCIDKQRRRGSGMRTIDGMVAFVCVYIPRRVLRAVGPLDESFDGYGFEDFDYCKRARAAGFEIAVFDGCVVEHGELPSTFRTRPDIVSLHERGRAVYCDKWNPVTK